MANRISISAPESFERDQRAALRFYSVIFAACGIVGAAVLFILASLPASGLVMAGLILAGFAEVIAASAAVLCFFASFPEFRGDDALRHN